MINDLTTWEQILIAALVFFLLAIFIVGIAPAMLSSMISQDDPNDLEEQRQALRKGKHDG